MIDHISYVIRCFQWPACCTYHLPRSSDSIWSALFTQKISSLSRKDPVHIAPFPSLSFITRFSIDLIISTSLSFPFRIALDFLSIFFRHLSRIIFSLSLCFFRIIFWSFRIIASSYWFPSLMFSSFLVISCFLQGITYLSWDSWSILPSTYLFLSRFIFLASLW